MKTPKQFYESSVEAQNTPWESLSNDQRYVWEVDWAFYFPVNNIEEHYRKNYAKLVKKLSFRAKTEWAAEDIVQTAYERALKYFNTANVEEFDKWFSRVLSNALYAYLNEEKGYTPLEEDFDEPIPDVFRKNEESRKVVLTTIDEEKHENKERYEILIYYYRYGYSAKEISEFSKYPYGMIRKVISRFNNKLKERFT